MNKETLEGAAKKYAPDFEKNTMSNISWNSVKSLERVAFKNGAKWQLENLSKEDLIKNLLVEEIVINFLGYRWNNNLGAHIYREQFKKYKQSILKEEKS